MLLARGFDSNVNILLLYGAAVATCKKAFHVPQMSPHLSPHLSG